MSICNPNSLLTIVAPVVPGRGVSLFLLLRAGILRGETGEGCTVSLCGQVATASHPKARSTFWAAPN